VSVEYSGPSLLKKTVKRFKVKAFDRAVWLRLSGNKYTDQIVPAVCQLKSLRTLVLSDTAISPAGRFRIQQALPPLKIFDKDPVAATATTGQWTTLGVNPLRSTTTETTP